MRWIILVLASLAATFLIIAGGIWWLTRPTDRIDASLQGDATRGETLAHISGCVACHTDTKNGGALLAGGKPLKTDFGSFYPPNITTDFDHGIGHWQLADLSKALRLGKSPQGHPYYPAFPYDSYTQLTDQDIADLFEYLRSIEPVAEPSTPHELGFPFNIRTFLHGWQMLYLDARRFEPDPSRSDQWNRGKYLVDAAGHCGACHTPRDALGGPMNDAYLQGSTTLPDNEKTPAITKEALTKSGFDADSLAFALDIGMLPDGDFFGGSMTEVVDLGTSKLSAEDRNAIAKYLMNQD